MSAEIRQEYAWLRLFRVVNGIESIMVQKVYAGPELIEALQRGPVIQGEAIEYFDGVAAEAFPGWTVHGYFTWDPRKKGIE